MPSGKHIKLISYTEISTVIRRISCNFYVM